MSIVVYDVQPNGELTELPGLSKDLLTNDRVLIVVAERQKKIYLWKGKNSSVRKKFVGARKASALRGEWGLVFKVIAMDEGDEDEEFLSLIGMEAKPPTPRPAPKPAVKKPIVEKQAAPPADQTRVAVAKPTQPIPQPAAQPSPPVKSAAQPVVQATYESSGHTLVPAQGEVATMKSDEGAAISTASPGIGVAGGFTGINENEVISKLNEIKVPKGYVREVVVIGPSIFAVKESRTSIFGKEKVERRLEKVKPPEGVFLVENFIPRVIAENGKILAIEFLREKSDLNETMEPLKSEMVKHLEDIISMFKKEKEK
ncbi:MAG: hypothetical protein ACTSWP_05845 [Candidatus Freyarchaeota archaeon]|nr:hypothetical protein [Candidatus Freyrarchaeum guaymaensis]